MARMFPGPGYRDFLQTRLRGLLAVALVLGSMVAAVVVIFALPLVQPGWCSAAARSMPCSCRFVEQACAIDLGAISAIGAIVATMVVAGAGGAASSTWSCPPDGASLRQAFLPALLVGVVIGLFTSLFGWLAPLLVREWLTLGVVGSVFIALIWFDLVFQALLYGAAFARLRRDARRGSRHSVRNAATTPADGGTE